MVEQTHIQRTRTGNPFPGLRPFDSDESLLFFGRDGLSDTLLEKLWTTRFVAVVGTSGSGKSSLVRAGLLPAVRSGFMSDTGSSWRVALFRPINNPIHNLAKSLLDCNIFPADGPTESLDRLRFIESNLRRSSLGLIETVRRARISSSENLLIVADQFEELFRFEPSAEVEHPRDEASAFVKLLLEATRQTEIPIFVILTMRSDYLGESAHFWGLPEAINRGQFLIPRMDDDERREAIEGPVTVRGAKISWPLVNRLLNDAGDDPRQLPILQHALMRTWEYWELHHQNSEPLGLEHYDNKQVGGMKQALSIHVDTAFMELTDQQKIIAEKMFKRLTEKGTGKREGRLPATVDEIAKIAGVPVETVLPVIEVFRKDNRSFLMPPPPTPLISSTLIDISHESLISGWKRLSEWVEEEAYSAKTYRRLVDDALLYPKKKGPLTNPELDFTRKWKSDQQPNATWARRYRSEFGKALDSEDPPARPSWAKSDASEYDIAITYLEISQQKYAEYKARKERQRFRTLIYVSLVAAVLFLACLGLLGFSTRAKSESARAERERIRAENARTTAENEKARAEGERASADAARAEAEKSREIADAQAKNAELASARAMKAQQLAEHERRNAVVALDSARDAAEEANRLRGLADAALKTAEVQAKRGNLLEEGIYLDLNHNSREAIQKYKELKDATTADLSKVAIAEILIGNTILKAVDYKDEPALPHFDTVLDLAQKQSVNLKPSVFIDIGNRLSERSVSEQALSAARFFDYAAEISGQGDDNLKADALIKAARLYAASAQTDDVKEAVERYRKALNILTDDTAKQINVNMLIGDAYRSSRQPGEARSAYQKALELAERTHNSLAIGDALRLIGDTHAAEADIVQALTAYNRAHEAFAVADRASASVSLVLADARVLEAMAAIKERIGDKVQADVLYRQARTGYGEVLRRSSKEVDLPMRRDTYSGYDRASAGIRRLRISLGDVLGKAFEEGGIDAGIKQYRYLKDNLSAEYDFSESTINSLGYFFLKQQKKVSEAIAIFKLNVEAYPGSANTYDSLGEAYMNDGKTDLAITNYETALRLDPNKYSAIEALRRLKGGR